MVSIKTIQKCQVSDSRFSKEWLIKLLYDDLSQEDFDLFCREVMLLNEHYQTTMGLTATDVPEGIVDLKGVTWELPEIDFNTPIVFRQIK